MRYRKIDGSNRIDEWQAMNKAIIVFIVSFLLMGIWAIFSKWINPIAAILPFLMSAFCCWWLFLNNYEVEK